MDGSQFKMGDEVTILVYQNRKSVGEVTSQMIDDEGQAVSVYLESDDGLMKLLEALKSAAAAVEYHAQKPRMRELIRARIAEMEDEEIEEEKSEPPSPTDELGDIPF